jgi:integrase
VAKVNFTAKRVQEHSCPDGKAQAFLWDAVSPGLGLRVTANGAKAYIFQGKIHGKTVRLTIGDPRSWTIDKAQEEARSLQTLIDAGKDPRTVKAEQRAAYEADEAAARRKDITVSEAWKDYVDARKSKWSERHYQDHERLAEAGGRNTKRGKGQIVAGPLASLMSLRLSDLTPETVGSWLEDEAENRPARARLAFSLLRAFVKWCDGRAEFTGLASLEICANKQLREHLPKPQTKADCLQREQLPAWFGAVRQIANPVISAYLQGLLLTGARREELAGLQWADVDFQWGSLTIRDKVEGERTIPLTPYLASLLAALPRRNEWVFSSPAAADGKIAEPRIAHTQALEVAGLPHVSLHGLRRSFGTLCEWVEMPSGISAQIMGHKPSAIAEKHYRRRPLDLLRMWHTKIEAWVLEQADIEFEASKAKPGLKVITAA